MLNNAFSKIFLIFLLFSLASCAEIGKYLPRSDESNLVAKADVAMRDHDWAKAVPLYEEAAYLKPDDLELRLKQAQAYQNDGKLAQAYNIYQLILNSKAPSNDANDYARSQAKAQQAKTGFKPEPLFYPEAKPDQSVVKPVQKSVTKPETKIPAIIPSVNADTTPAATAPSEQQAQINANKAVLDELAGWREAWVSRNLKAYFSHYIEDYAGDASSVNDWRQQRKAKMSAAKSIRLTLSDVQVKVMSDELAEVSFKQVFQAGSYKDVGHKTMQMKLLQDRWLISQESFK